MPLQRPADPRKSALAKHDCDDMTATTSVRAERPYEGMPSVNHQRGIARRSFTGRNGTLAGRSRCQASSSRLSEAPGSRTHHDPQGDTNDRGCHQQWRVFGLSVFPGHLAPGNRDHGLGPLATIMESFLAPGAHIELHEHVVDEIVSWVPAGVMRHDDPEGGRLTVDANHLMVTNAGRGFQHEERTRDDDPPLRMLQIFVRPDAEGLDPRIQHGPLAQPRGNEWRHVFGPVRGGAPFEVRNAVDCRDVRLAGGQTTSLPTEAGRVTYFFVFSGCVAADGQTFGEAESGLTAEGGHIQLEAKEDAVVLAFIIDPKVQVCRGGTVGDGETVHRIAAQTLG